jgi:hypothetical protein
MTFPLRYGSRDGFNCSAFSDEIVHSHWVMHLVTVSSTRPFRDPVDSDHSVNAKLRSNKKTHSNFTSNLNQP